MDPAQLTTRRGVLLRLLLLLAVIAVAAVAIARPVSAGLLLQQAVTVIPVPGAFQPSYQPPAGEVAYVVSPEHVRGISDSTTTLAQDLANNVIPAGAHDGQCLQWLSGSLVWGMCQEVAVTGAFTGYVAYSPNRAFIAEEFTGGGRPNGTFTGTYTSVNEYSATVNYPAPPTGTWNFDNSIVCPVAPAVCGYLGYALPTPPGRPGTQGSGFGGVDLDFLYFTQGDLVLNGVNHTILVAKRANDIHRQSTLFRSTELNWDEWTGTGLADIPDPGAPTPPDANAFPPASASTMMAGWATCLPGSSSCLPRANTDAVTRFESGNPVTLPAQTGTVRPTFIYQNATDPLNTFDTTYRPTLIALASDPTTNLVGQFTVANITTGPFTGWTTRVQYLIGPEVTNPADTDYVVTQ